MSSIQSSSDLMSVGVIIIGTPRRSKKGSLGSSERNFDSLVIEDGMRLITESIIVFPFLMRWLSMIPRMPMPPVSTFAAKFKNKGRQLQPRFSTSVMRRSTAGNPPAFHFLWLKATIIVGLDGSNASMASSISTDSMPGRYAP